jgi:hypothetical protein
MRSRNGGGTPSFAEGDGSFAVRGEGGKVEKMESSVVDDRCSST